MAYRVAVHAACIRGKPRLHSFGDPDSRCPSMRCSAESCRILWNDRARWTEAPDPYTILKELGHGMTATAVASGPGRVCGGPYLSHPVPESSWKVYKCRRDDQIFAVKAIGLSRCACTSCPVASLAQTTTCKKGCRCSATKKRPWNDCAESQEPIVFAEQLYSRIRSLHGMLMTGSVALGSID